jgi:hypothetical protein
MRVSSVVSGISGWLGSDCGVARIARQATVVTLPKAD